MESSTGTKRRIDAKRLDRVSAALQHDIDTGYIHGAAMRVSLGGVTLYRGPGQARLAGRIICIR